MFLTLLTMADTEAGRKHRRVSRRTRKWKGLEEGEECIEELLAKDGGFSLGMDV